MIGCIVRDTDLIDDNGDGELEVVSGTEFVVEVEGGREFRSGAISVSHSRVLKERIDDVKRL